MSHSLFGLVMGVRRFANGDIEVDFYHDDQITEYRHYADPGRLGGLPRILAESLASTLATDVCTEIFFDDDGNATHVELEECDDSGGEEP